jgi:carbamoyltransferase
MKVPSSNLTESLIHMGAFWPSAKKFFNDSFPVWSKDRLNISKTIKRELGENFTGKISYTDHHLSHAASAFFPSPFEKSAILTLDAVGEWSTSSIGMVGNGNHIELFREIAISPFSWNVILGIYFLYRF